MKSRSSKPPVRSKTSRGMSMNAPATQSTSRLLGVVPVTGEQQTGPPFAVEGACRARGFRSARREGSESDRRCAVGGRREESSGSGRRRCQTAPGPFEELGHRLVEKLRVAVEDRTQAPFARRMAWLLARPNPTFSSLRTSRTPGIRLDHVRASVARGVVDHDDLVVERATDALRANARHARSRSSVFQFTTTTDRSGRGCHGSVSLSVVLLEGAAPPSSQRCAHSSKR